MGSKNQESRRRLTIAIVLVVLVVLFFVFPRQKKKDTHITSEVKYLENIQTIQERKYGALEKELKSLSVKDICGKQQYRCVPGSNGKVGYVYFLNNSTGLAVPTRGRDGDDYTTYFEYIHASAARLRSLTRLPIVILITSGVPEVHRTLLKKLGLDVRIVKPLYEQLEKGLKTDRAYHLHSFGKLEVFNPRWLNDFKKIIHLDTDTFVVRAPDELFCLPGKFAAAKRMTNLRSGFNSGVFIAEPSEISYMGVTALLRQGIESNLRGGDNTNSFGDQPLLNNFFEKSNKVCFSSEYNCVGFGPPHAGAKSAKCGIKDSEESKMLNTVSIIHAKLSQEKISQRLPSTAALWRKSFPKDERYTHIY